MKTKTRYFVTGAVALLLVGIGGGLVAYLVQNRAAALPDGLPPEVRLIPSDVELIGYADVKAILASELHQKLMPTIESGDRKGHRMMHEIAGVDLEKQVNYILGYVERQTSPDPDPQTDRPHVIPHAVLLVNGTFDQALIEQRVRERGGEASEHNGRKMFVHRENGHEMAVGFARADLLAMGRGDTVRRALDAAASPPRDAASITSNAEVMNLVRDSAGGSAWVVARSDAMTRRMKLPPAVTGQVPPLRFVSARADVNGGIKARFRADASDKASADQLRDVVRGFVAMGRMAGGQKPGLDALLKSIEVSGTDNTVRLSFALPADTLAAVAPRRPQ